MFDPGSNINVLEEPAFACDGASLFDLGAEPVVVVHRTGGSSATTDAFAEDRESDRRYLAGDPVFM
jgi:hypothetical protein